MNQSKSSAASTVEWALAQHRELDEEVRTLKSFLGFCPTAGALPVVVRNWSRDMAKMVTRLRERLDTHFRFEEGSPLYGKLAEEFPRYAHRLENLLHEHEVMLSELVGIHRDAELADTVDQVRLLRGRMESVIAMLDAHERAENEILQAAFTDDIGPGD